ncbi:MAG TPA: phosphatidate cytidylyltransferase, partial [Pararhizobium sp.]|nr:phosphatidate cytidylyltransferase [Pararhizobium sp.]
MRSELARRIFSGILLAIVVLAATWFDGFAFRTLAAIAALLIYYEWSMLVGARAAAPRIDLFAWIVVLLVAVAIIIYGSQMAVYLALIGGIVACIWGWSVLRSAWIGAGLLYASFSGIALAAIRGDTTAGLVAMLFIFAIVWATDVAAYFTGRHFGGPKLAPRISPSKTWSGAIGGTVAGVVAGTIVALVAENGTSGWIPLAALFLSIISQLGDLFESWVKRRFGVKDSSQLIPGHGGVMDRVDGLVFAAFAAYVFIAL